uniref:TACC_C domain-containing protein n=1 Tax=Strongyloides papillosus TaxID=174720 RepID=A0A0N5CHQ4_STREA
MEAVNVSHDIGKTMTKKSGPLKNLDDTVSSTGSIPSMNFGNQDTYIDSFSKKQNIVTSSDLPGLYKEILSTADRSEVVDQIVKIIQLHSKTEVDNLLRSAVLQESIFHGQCEQLLNIINRVRGGDVLIEKENTKDSSVSEAQLNALVRRERDVQGRYKKLLQKKDILDKEMEEVRKTFEYCIMKEGEYKKSKVNLMEYLDYLKASHARCKAVCKQLKAESDAEIHCIQGEAEIRAQDMVTNIKLYELRLKDIKTQIASFDSKIKEMTAILQDILAQNEDEISDNDSRA